MRRRQFAAPDLAHRVGEEAQPPPGGDRRVELAQRAGRAVARVRQRLLAVPACMLVERFEVLVQHDDFAAHFEHIGPALAAQLQRDRAHGAQVRGDVLAGLAIAAGGALHEHAVFVAQADRQAVQLGFHRKHRIAPIQGLLDAPLELDHFPEAFTIGLAVLLECIAQRQHRDRVAHLGETALRARADLARRRIGRGQRGVVGFDRLQLAHQPVVLGVGDIRIVEHVIAVVGLLDQCPQRGGAGQGLDGNSGYCHAGLLLRTV
ncbi:hypothetical protein RLIN73S_04400 [Rhodanobacter lindaniclasticus]